MQQLEPVQQQAIDLLVSGKRQNEVARELNLSTRTLRRWGENETFVDELNQQHALARKLERDEAAELRREHRELQRLALQQIKTNLTDPHAPLELKKHCLRLSLMAVHFDIAQEWREFVYADRKREAAEKEAAARAALKPAPVTVPIRGCKGTVIAHVFPEQARIYERMMREADEAEAKEKARKAARPLVLQAARFKASTKGQPKADESGHAGHRGQKNPLIDAICADVLRKQTARR